MADIDVVPKKGTNIWLWIILAIVLAVILFALMGSFSGGSDRVGELMKAVPADSTAGAVSAFV
jgi:hypothetical protein